MKCYSNEDMHCIIETDLGHDPDDFFTICYLDAIGVKIDAITITPGDPDQIAIANLLRKELSLNCPVGVSKLDSDKYSSGGLHYDLLKRYGMFGDLRKIKHRHDGFGNDVIKDVYNGQHILIIGPATNIRMALQNNLSIYNCELTFQGGFLPYKYFRPDIRLDKFENIDAIGSFNMNGDKKAVEQIVKTSAFSKTFIGKHLCHTVEFDQDHYVNTTSNKTRSGDLFVEAADILFSRTKNKKMHDLVAAACMIYPWLGKYINCDILHTNAGWTSIPNDKSDCQVISQLDREQFWERVLNFI